MLESFVITQASSSTNHLLKGLSKCTTRECAQSDPHDNPGERGAADTVFWLFFCHSELLRRIFSCRLWL